MQHVRRSGIWKSSRNPPCFCAYDNVIWRCNDLDPSSDFSCCASEVTTLWRYTNMFIIYLLLLLLVETEYVFMSPVLDLQRTPGHKCLTCEKFEIVVKILVVLGFVSVFNEPPPVWWPAVACSSVWLDSQLVVVNLCVDVRTLRPIVARPD